MSPSDSDRQLLLRFSAGPCSPDEFLLVVVDAQAGAGFDFDGGPVAVAGRHLITPEKDFRWRLLLLAAESSSSSISFSCSMLLLSVVGAAPPPLTL